MRVSPSQSVRLLTPVQSHHEQTYDVFHCTMYCRIGLWFVMTSCPGHVAYVGEMRKADKILIGKPERTPRRREVEVKVKFSLCLTKHHDVICVGGVEV